MAENAENENFTEDGKETEDKNLSSKNEKPKGISEVMWQRFQKLKQKREEVSKKSTEKRIRQLQKQIIDKVHKEFKHDEDIDILQQHLAEEAQSVTQRGEKRKLPDSKKPVSSTETGEDASEWLKIKGHLNEFDNLTAACTSQHAPKSGLEAELEDALASGNVTKAEDLSNKLANREFGAKIANAFDAKRFSEKKKKEEEIIKAKKQKKLNWRFEHKEKWEMKANM